MDDLAELVWRKALQVRGREWVMSELRTRPGRPEDVVYDVVFEQPYPTRAFCQQWCAEEENKIVRMSWHTYAAVFTVILFVVCLFKAVQSWNAAGLPPPQPPSAGASQPAIRGNPDNITNSVPSQASSANGASAGSGNSSSGTNPPSTCAYITYDTTRCKVQN